MQSRTASTRAQRAGPCPAIDSPSSPGAGTAPSSGKHSPGKAKGTHASKQKGSLSRSGGNGSPAASEETRVWCGALEHDERAQAISDLHVPVWACVSAAGLAFGCCRLAIGRRRLASAEEEEKKEPVRWQRLADEEDNDVRRNSLP